MDKNTPSQEMEAQKHPNAKSIIPRIDLITFSSILKFFFFISIVYALYQLIPLFMLLFLSILLAITISPLVEKLQKKNIPKWIIFGGIASCIIVSFVAFMFLLLPQLIDQLVAVPKLISSLKTEYVGKINNLWFKGQVEAILNHRIFNGDMPDNLFKLGSKVVSILIDMGIVLTFTFYFLLDGKRAYYWAVAFFKDETRQKIHRTTHEFNAVVTKYIAGQFILSAMVGIYVFTILSALKIPVAMTLSLIAAVLEVLPIVGFLSTLFIIGLVTLSVAPSKALLVFGLFLLYHFFDAYVLIPKVYGNRMRMSGLVVLSSLLISIKLGGIIAGILILPLIASYPIVERIWLKKQLGRRTVRDHQKLERIIDNPPNL